MILLQKPTITLQNNYSVSLKSLNLTDEPNKKTKKTDAEYRMATSTAAQTEETYACLLYSWKIYCGKWWIIDRIRLMQTLSFYSETVTTTTTGARTTTRATKNLANISTCKMSVFFIWCGLLIGVVGMR